MPFLSFRRNQKQESNFQQVGGLVTRNISIFFLQICATSKVCRTQQTFTKVFSYMLFLVILQFHALIEPKSIFSYFASNHLCGICFLGSVKLYLENKSARSIMHLIYFETMVNLPQWSVNLGLSFLVSSMQNSSTVKLIDLDIYRDLLLFSFSINVHIFKICTNLFLGKK